MLEVWLPLLGFMVLIGSWYHVLRLRERATAHARHLCELHGVQLLDDSVALHRLRMGWRRGALHVMREYRFETSRGGDDRQSASVSLLGDRIVGERMPAHARPETAAVPVPAAYGAPPAQAAPDAGNKIVPITRARRTLH
ncbi:MAG TPA: DUF3301 domain-containing protein [Rhodanobacteraceae bacterium]|nr:DUF3301 domain-containing protein [Rhodanobacteraceae bacterium]